MSTDFVPIYTANGHLNAEIIKGLLESNGIRVFLSGESLGTSYGLTMGPLAEVDVLVPASQVEDAQNVIDAMERGDFDTPIDDNEIGDLEDNS